MNLLSEKKESFINYLEKVRGSSEKSVKTYINVLGEALERISVFEKDDFIIADLMNYRKEIASQSKKTIGKKVSIVRSYLGWLKEGGAKIKIKNDTQVKAPKSLPKPVKTSYIKEALKDCNALERILLLVIYSLGLRISEVAQLKAKDFGRGWVEVYGKGSKTRVLPVLEGLEAEIGNFIKTNGSKEFLFEEDGEKLSENQLRYKVDIIFKRIGIKVTPHQLRHSFATDLLNDGARITDVSELLGHSALSTTEIYTKLSSSLKLKSYLNSHPLCKDEA